MLRTFTSIVSIVTIYKLVDIFLRFFDILSCLRDNFSILFHSLINYSKFPSIVFRCKKLYRFYFLFSTSLLIVDWNRFLEFCASASISRVLRDNSSWQFYRSYCIDHLRLIRVLGRTITVSITSIIFKINGLGWVCKCLMPRNV